MKKLRKELLDREILTWMGVGWGCERVRKREKAECDTCMCAISKDKLYLTKKQ